MTMIPEQMPMNAEQVEGAIQEFQEFFNPPGTVFTIDISDAEMQKALAAHIWRVVNGAHTPAMDVQLRQDVVEWVTDGMALEGLYHGS